MTGTGEVWPTFCGCGDFEREEVKKMKTWIVLSLAVMSLFLALGSTAVAQEIVCTPVNDQCDLSAATLGVNNVTVPAGTSVFINQVSGQGYSQFSVYHFCLGTYQLRWRIFDADGNVQTGSTLTDGLSGVGMTTVLSSVSDPVAFSATGTPVIETHFQHLRGPFRSIQFGFLAGGSDLTGCYATLVMQK